MQPDWHAEFHVPCDVTKAPLASSSVAKVATGDKEIRTYGITTLEGNDIFADESHHHP